MITQDYINGYINALNTLEEGIVSDRQAALDIHNYDAIIALDHVLTRIQSTKESYKQLVKQLNDK